jgi:hypothetical protein
MFADYVVLWTGLGFMVILAGMLYLIRKNNPDRDLGEVLTTSVINQNEVILDVIIIFLYLAEAITAASVHTEGAGPMSNPFARLITHLLISSVGAVANLTLIKDIATIFRPMPISYGIINAFIALILLTISISVPFANLDMIASNLSSEFEFRHWIYSLTASETSYQNFLIKYKYPENYKVWENLPVQLKVSIWTAMVHYLVMVLLSLRTLSTPTRRALLFLHVDKYEKKAEAIIKPKEKEEKEEKKEESKEEKKEEKKEDKKPERSALADNIEYLLKQYGYKDQIKVQNIVKAVQEKLKNTDQETVSTSVELAGLRLKFEEYYQTKKNDPRELDNLRNSLKSIFEDPKKLNIRLGNKGN